MKKILMALGFLTAALGIGLYTGAGVVRAAGSYTYDFITTDNGMNGQWATDHFHSKVTITPAGEGCYTVVREDGGTFETITGAKSPGGDGTTLVSAGATGTITGGITDVVCGTLRETPLANDTPEDLRSGSYSSYEDKYFHRFFSEIESGNITAWGWTFKTCNNGTWTDNEGTESAWQSDKTAMGDITGEYKACVTPPPCGDACKPYEVPKSIPTAPQCTDQQPALGVANVNVIRTSDTTALVQWSIHSGNQTHIVFGETGTGWHHAALNVGVSGQATINFLVKGRTYDWQVIPMNGCAAGARSPVVKGV